LAQANGGKAPGFRFFERETGIREAAWRGVYWPRWTDAVKDAGLEPNTRLEKIEEGVFLRKLADAFRALGKVPVAMELRIYRRSNPDFPFRAIVRHFGTTPNMHRRLFEWATENDYADVAAMLSERGANVEPHDDKPQREGFVYLIRWGNNYKIGRGEQLEKRVKQVRTGLPESGSLEHAIRTDDPPGIEAYWHRRFESKRAENGEWFKLSNADVAAFKRRKFQ
jgi:hypothetical protein